MKELIRKYKILDQKLANNRKELWKHKWVILRIFMEFLGGIGEVVFTTSLISSFLHRDD